MEDELQGTQEVKKKQRRLAAAAPVIVVMLLALTLRFVYLAQVHDSPLFQVPQIDAGEYDALAQEMADGDWMAPEGKPYWQPPGYPFFLALLYSVFGHNLLLVRILQFLMGAASCGLVYAIASRFFSRRVALLAGIICATNASLIYYEGELLTPALTIFLNLTAIWLLLAYQEKPAWWRPALSGLLLGLSGIARPDALVFVPVALLWMFFAFRKQPGRNAAIALLAVAAALPVVAVTVRNYVESQQPVIISWNGGVNFYIGNSVYSTGLQRIRPGTDWSKLTSMPIADGAKSESAQSSYFYRRTLWEYRTRSTPAAFAKQLVKKAVLFWNAKEIRRNHDDYYNRSQSSLYATLLWTKGKFGFPFGVLGPLALLGIGVCLPKKRDLALLYGFIATQFVVVVAFFVCSRYRAPVIPVLSIFAASALVEVWRNLRRRDLFGAAGLLLILIPFIAVSMFRSPLVNENSRLVEAETRYYLGHAYNQIGNEDAGLRELEASVRLNPREANVRAMLGAMYVKRGRTSDAIRELRAAVKMDPGIEEAKRVLETLEETGASP